MRVATGKLKRMIEARQVIVFGCIQDSRSGAVVEAYQETGYDALIIDREHTALNTETIAELLRLARALDLPCTVRVADDCYHELNRTLDQAPDGVFVPRIHSREQVERLVQTVKYPPLGLRGLAGSTCPAGKYMGWGSVPEQIDTINASVVVGIQIETAEALADLDGILSVPGVDVAVIGNDDLSMGMGIPGQLDAPEYHAAVERVIEACERHGVLPGIAGGDPAVVCRWIQRGMRVIWYASDICLLWAAARQQMAALRDALSETGWRP
jgi:2-dehydro-3-deoxyglucarate aldolase/4-hydroxy-2-oxoheptanedioate aldolase